MSNCCRFFRVRLLLGLIHTLPTYLPNAESRSSLTHSNKSATGHPISYALTSFIDPLALITSCSARHVTASEWARDSLGFSVLCTILAGTAVTLKETDSLSYALLEASILAIAPNHSSCLHSLRQADNAPSVVQRVRYWLLNVDIAHYV